METMQTFLRQEAAKALEKWQAAERAVAEVTDPQLAEFAAYNLEAAKKKYLYILHILKCQEQPDNGSLTVL